MIMLEQISIFLANNYIWFIIGAVLFLFALIGYIFDAKKKKTIAEKTEVLETIKLDDNAETLEDLKEQMGDRGNVSLNKAVTDSTTEINTEELKETEENKEEKKEEETEQLDDVPETKKSDDQVEALIQEESPSESTFQG